MSRASDGNMANVVDGGYDTARVTSSDADIAARQARQRDALAYLIRTDNTDIVAEALGLVVVPKRRSRPEPVHKTFPPKTCPLCQREFSPANPRQKTCSRLCGRQSQVLTLRKRRSPSEDTTGGVSA